MYCLNFFSRKLLVLYIFTLLKEFAYLNIKLNFTFFFLYKCGELVDKNGAIRSGTSCYEFFFFTSPKKWTSSEKGVNRKIKYKHNDKISINKRRIKLKPISLLFKHICLLLIFLVWEYTCLLLEPLIWKTFYVLN